MRRFARRSCASSVVSSAYHARGSRRWRERQAPGAAQLEPRALRPEGCLSPSAADEPGHRNPQSATPTPKGHNARRCSARAYLCFIAARVKALQHSLDETRAGRSSGEEQEGCRVPGLTWSWPWSRRSPTRQRRCAPQLRQKLLYPLLSARGKQALHRWQRTDARQAAAKTYGAGKCQGTVPPRCGPAAAHSPAGRGLWKTGPKGALPAAACGLQRGPAGWTFET